MRVDKTLSELWDLADDGEFGETARMAINTIKKLQEENQFLYGKLNQISSIIEEGREESRKF